MSSPPIDEAEVVVVGGGPAGAACAALLAERGRDVLIIDQDRFPRDKPCGDGLTRSSVGFLERIGLGELLSDCQPIEGLRVVFDHRSYDYKSYGSARGKPHLARCVPREQLDAAILDVALSRGARLRQARVDGPVLSKGRAAGVRVTGANLEGWVRSRCVVAADGATSRMRRALGFGRRTDGMMAYAVRRYFETEEPLEPVFDVYAPVEDHGHGAVGYGWVFPVGRHVANVGIGYWRGGGLDAPSRIREVLTTFVEDLQLKASVRFGDMRPLSKAFGSPLGVNFMRDRCQVHNIVFVGDAAGTTDPLSGEGIAYALHGAEEIVSVVEALVREEKPAVDAGSILGRRFPRLGQDISLPARLAERRLNETARSVGTSVKYPFLGSLRRIVASSEDEPGLADTAVATLATSRGLDLTTQLESFNQLILDELMTEFPFGVELLHREMRARSGPVLAAVALAAGARDPADGRSSQAGMALELFRAGGRCAAQVSDRCGDRQSKLNNAFCVLIGDFALSRALRAAAGVSPWMVISLSDAMSRLCEAQFQESRDLFMLDRPVERYMHQAAEKAGSLMALAAEAGGKLAGEAQPTTDQLRRFGHQFGVALEISNDIIEFVRGDDVTGKGPAADIRHGVYGLPVIFALAEDGELRRTLVQGANSEEELDQVVEAVGNAGGLKRALDELRGQALLAKDYLESFDGGTATALRVLADLPLSQAEAALAVGPSVEEPRPPVARAAAAA